MPDKIESSEDAWACSRYVFFIAGKFENVIKSFRQ